MQISSCKKANHAPSTWTCTPFTFNCDFSRYFPLNYAHTGITSFSILGSHASNFSFVTTIRLLGAVQQGNQQHCRGLRKALLWCGQPDRPLALLSVGSAQSRGPQCEEQRPLRPAAFALQSQRSFKGTYQRRRPGERQKTQMRVPVRRGTAASPRAGTIKTGLRRGLRRCCRPEAGPRPRPRPLHCSCKHFGAHRTANKARCSNSRVKR